MAQEIIGREPEIKEIEALYQTNKPVFAVVYGRRRVGKTFLIRELLGDKFAFYHTGLSPYELQGKKLKEQQLSNFYSSIELQMKSSSALLPWGNVRDFTRQTIS